MNEDSIIVFLYVYKFHLFVSYLNGEISIIQLPYSPDKISIFPSLIRTSNVATEFQARSDVLFACSSERIFSHDLTNINQLIIEDFHLSNEVPECSQLVMDEKNLFGFSSKKGISTININNPRNSYFVKNYIPKIAERLGDLPVSNLDAKKGDVFMSIRNFGITKIKYKYNHFNDLEVLNEISNIRLEDPQDIKSHPKKDLLFALDSEEGFAIINSVSDKILSKLKLPENDLGQELRVFRGDILIKGKFGLYHFNLINQTIYPLVKKKVGTFTTYLDLIFYTNEGKINILKYGSVAHTEISYYENNLPKFNSIASLNF
ncbi:MAG TPA: hypothetical protein VK590_03595 [Saprospiraceae bacterium]|nr:hypothetical protein [Saprospiraceae bacterium]